MRYVLASASERRCELLKRIIDDFNVVVSNFNEDTVEFDGNIPKYVESIALGKAKEVMQSITEPSIIIAADTVVSINNEILGKPKDEDDAYNMLCKLSDNIHEVFSGIVVINTKSNKILKESLKTKVFFSRLEEKEIKEYIKSKEPMDKAGAYGIQGKGGVFVKRIEGCYYNVVGLPLNKLNEMIKKIQ
ncbi:MAG: Maf-like protein [Clostridiaceae bacterium]|nr:Maf-like protein [Clostridiaceae bacterium]